MGIDFQSLLRVGGPTVRRGRIRTDSGVVFGVVLRVNIGLEIVYKTEVCGGLYQKFGRYAHGGGPKFIF